ncbi:hypothetical protein EDD66_10697 [Mobilisporobacter senegalensis]|uniref:DUF4832 domain-containing protein n=1 Tax=Mobilisporobacter senegalensis TaxID=1329262 RepID=A0A3N1XL11_9FIRM|nr:DUF4832 domain-containing protein [Mobilisporobacter senegalensis]ROR27400.1 hypothetical protein EDD66_10697 [Mobilisporobacter senegalensis]
MGKYSLENYEIYKTKKIRPDLLKTATDNYGRGQITYINCSWADLEPKRGCYKLESILDEVSKTANPVLILKPDYPDWINIYPEECFARFIRRVGSFFLGKDIRLIGVVISTIGNNVIEWNAYIEGFKDITLFADVHNYELIRFLKNENQNFGLWISCNEDNWISCCEDLASQNLQCNWERKPTLLHVIEDSCGFQVIRQSKQWHAGFSNKKLDLGFLLALRRLTYPDKVSSNGVLPMRFWFANNGDSPCYNELCIKLQLVRGDESYIIPLLNSPTNWHVGDIIHNEIIQLPNLLEGNYSISVGLFYKNNDPVYMAINQNNMDGFYKMGELTIDYTNRDNLKNVWEYYYPEGYYPLEDPQSPESE